MAGSTTIKDLEAAGCDGSAPLQSLRNSGTFPFQINASMMNMRSRKFLAGSGNLSRGHLLPPR
jgi:hypothetical protein